MPLNVRRPRRGLIEFTLNTNLKAHDKILSREELSGSRRRMAACRRANHLGQWRLRSAACGTCALPARSEGAGWQTNGRHQFRRIGARAEGRRPAHHARRRACGNRGRARGCGCGRDLSRARRTSHHPRDSPRYSRQGHRLHVSDSVPERDAVAEYGGRVEIVGDAKDHSTTELFARGSRRGNLDRGGRKQNRISSVCSSCA